METLELCDDKPPNFALRLVYNVTIRLVGVVIISLFYYLESLPYSLSDRWLYIPILIIIFFYGLWAAYSDSLILLKKITLESDVFHIIYQEKNVENVRTIAKNNLRVEKLVAKIPYLHIAGVEIWNGEKMILEQRTNRIYWPSKYVKKLMAWLEEVEH